MGTQHGCSGCQLFRRVSFLTISGVISLTGWLTNNPSLAQITPDATLGNEPSVVTPNINVRGLPAELIEGGAVRDANLFHSFLEFNINDGQRVYFANPAGIENILTRVTGNNPSNILGTLGVDGRANLFLLNPHGIIFGSNAQLDIPGSFLATTADSLVFENNDQFSATHPQVPSLLAIKVPLGLQYGTQPPGAITNAGSLKVGGNFTLVGGTVTSAGTLAAPAGYLRVAAVDGDAQVRDVSALSAILLAHDNLILQESQLFTAGDLTLLAGDTVWVRDSVQNPFVAHAGGNLYIQGNRGIDILALNHPETPFQSAGNLSLVSDGIISGDAHFASGGKFSILNLSGEPGNFVSFYDPIISSERDVVLGDYTGVSLKVEAKGSITTGNITITGSDTTLPQGSNPDIDILKSSPALILRAGVAELENPPTLSIPVYSDDFEGEVPSVWSNTSTDITPIGNRKFLGQFGNGSVSLTLDDLPAHTSATVSFKLFIIRSWDGNNTQDGSDIWNLSVEGGQTLLNTTFSNHDFLLNDQPGYPQTQSFPSDYNPLSLVENPARTGVSESNNSLGYKFFLEPINEIKPFDSVYNLSHTFSHSDTSVQLDFSASLTSDINDESWGLDNVRISVEPTLTSPEKPPINSISDEPTLASPGVPSLGRITVSNLSTLGGPIILSATGGIQTRSITTKGGTISIDSGGSINTTAGILDSFSNNNGGAITLTADGDIETGSMNSQGGDISLDSGGSINTTAGILDSFSNNNGGAITLTADGDINIGEIRSSGDLLGGSITLTSEAGVISIDGSKVIRSDTFGTGRGGDINITARSGSVVLTNGARVLTGTFNDGVGGNLTVTASKLVELSGTSPDGRILTLLSTANGGSKSAGDLTINTGRLIVRDGAVIGASTSGVGRGGDLTVKASESVELIGTSPYGFPSGLSTDTIGTGEAGNLTIDTRRFIARDGAGASASTFSSGKGGSLTVNAESVELIGTAANGFASGLYAQAFSDGDADNLTINTKDLIIRGEAKVTVASGPAEDARVPIRLLALFDFGANTLRPPLDPDPTGNAGNIIINASETLSATNGDITTTAERSSGGAITITAQNIRLYGDSDITTSVFNGADNGGNITLTADSIVAFDDSDILAFARDGRGGNITFNTPAFFGFRYRPAPRGTDPTTLDDNNRVDINASGAVSGAISLPDVTFIQNSLTDLPENLIDTDNLLANSCIARSNHQNGNFIITGAGNLPPRPGDASVSSYPTGDVRTVPSESVSRRSSSVISSSGTSHSWQIGDPIVEPTGVYQLQNGQLIMSRDCS